LPAKAEQYRAELRKRRDWDAYLKANSGLPGPRGNLELLAVAGDEASEEQLWRWSGSDDEYLASVGTAGLGRFAFTDQKVVPHLEHMAADPRWRVREGVAMALQRMGDADWDALLRAVIPWVRHRDLYVRRAAAAGVCEPRLLKDAKHAHQALLLVDQIIALVPRVTDRKSDAFRSLRQALGYCASVAAAAAPALGRRMFESWLESDDPDVRWIVKSNFGKSRMSALGTEWLETQRKRHSL
jgi:HEAT repeat protein